MTKHKLLYILIFILLIAGSVCFFVYPKFQKNNISNSIPDNTTVILFPSLDGDYVLDTENPLQDSNVKISSSSEKEILYKISTVNFGHLGDIEGIAKRTASSSLIYESVLESEIDDSGEICSVVVSFSDTNNLFYKVSGEACSQYKGVHGAFFDNEVHKKNGSVNLPTIEKLGFTKEDLIKFSKLLPAEKDGSGPFLKYAQGFINSEAANIEKITSPDIPNAIGYSIETPNMYSGVSLCFSDSEKFSGGFCIFVAFMKNDVNDYWILEGSNNGDDFRYATNNLQWKKKLPSVFQSELDRIGISKTVVKFLP